MTAGDYARPFRIARFIGELDSGFRLLNLKNDALRKRFDALKYDMKKVTICALHPMFSFDLGIFRSQDHVLVTNMTFTSHLFHIN